MPNDISMIATTEQDYLDLLPTQLIKTRAATGERRLLTAVLETALMDIFSPRLTQPGTNGSEDAQKRGKAAQSARQWIADRSRIHWGDFENVCISLDMDPECIRRWIVALDQGKRKTNIPAGKGKKKLHAT